MKNFYMKHRNSLIVMTDVIIIVLGIISQKYAYAIIGLVLFVATLYIISKEKEAEEKKAQAKAQLKALRKEQHLKNKGKKKKKNKKRK